MKKARVFVRGIPAGFLYEEEPGRRYVFQYDPAYAGPAASLTLPTTTQRYEFDKFPPYFEGLLPEGAQLDALLTQSKLDRNDSFGQLLLVGADLSGTVTVESIHE